MNKKLKPSLLRPSQLDVSDFIISNPACLVASDMGFGKTASGITAIEKLLRRGEVNKVLIISTLAVTKSTWPEELQAWEHASDLKFVRISGSPEDRLKKAASKAHIYIINQELFVWLAEKAGKKWPYDMLVFDDVSGFSSGQRRSKRARCHFDKDCPLYVPGGPYGCKTAVARCPYSFSCPTAKGCQAAVRCENYKEGVPRPTRFGAVCALRKKIKRLVHLSGTPSGHDLLDLWPLIYSLDQGVRLGRTLSDYKRRYFTKSQNGFSWTLRPESGPVIAEKIKDICIAVPSEAKVPPLYHVKRPITLPKKAAELYKRLVKDWVINADNPDRVEAANAGVLAIKLLQICSGAIFKDAKEGQPKEWLLVHDEKIKEAQRIKAKHPNSPILIIYKFTHELIRLKAAFPDGRDVRDLKDAVSKWNAGEIPIMFGHPGSMGHGLNLQKGPGHVMILFCMPSLKQYKQVIKRLHRPGQKRKVYLYYLIVEKLADEIAMNSVAWHDHTQQQFLNAIVQHARTLK